MGFSDTTESGLCFRMPWLSLFLKQRFTVCMLEETLFNMALQLPLMSPTFALHS